MQLISSLIAGLMFGLGLIISGMANPAKVLNFLDLFGSWDPSLIFVMGGAIAVSMPGFWLIKKRSAPLFSDIFHFPTRKDVEPRLLAGAVFFGVGWGLGGFCPGPAITAIPLMATGTLVFMVALLAGVFATRLLR